WSSLSVVGSLFSSEIVLWWRVKACWFCLFRGVLQVSSWALRRLSLSVKLLRRWGLLYMGFRFNGCNGPVKRFGGGNL
ncbi:unnamed protein product, partial [Brassica rapa]